MSRSAKDFSKCLIKVTIWATKPLVKPLDGVRRYVGAGMYRYILGRVVNRSYDVLLTGRCVYERTGDVESELRPWHSLELALTDLRQYELCQLIRAKA